MYSPFDYRPRFDINNIYETDNQLAKKFFAICIANKIVVKEFKSDQDWEYLDSVTFETYISDLGFDLDDALSDKYLNKFTKDLIVYKAQPAVFGVMEGDWHYYFSNQTYIRLIHRYQEPGNYWDNIDIYGVSNLPEEYEAALNDWFSKASHKNITIHKGAPPNAVKTTTP